jgi:hypothetical protein
LLLLLLLQRLLRTCCLTSWTLRPLAALLRLLCVRMTCHLRS